MSDVHSVGGYITAGSLFALGLSSWQVLVALLVGICIVQFFCNMVAKPSQVTSTPYPVICRASFGVRGANIPAIIRGLIAVAWYGIQTYLASAAFMVLALHLFPNLAPYADVKLHGFAGLSTLGWVAFMVMWVLQAFEAAGRLPRCAGRGRGQRHAGRAGARAGGAQLADRDALPLLERPALLLRRALGFFAHGPQR